MKLVKFSLFCISASLFSSICSAEPVDDFTLLDHEGKSHQLSWYGDQQAIVIFVQGNDSPMVRNSVPRLKKIRDEFGSKDVTFFMLNPEMQDNRTSIAEEAEQLGYDFPILG